MGIDLKEQTRTQNKTSPSRGSEQSGNNKMGAGRGWQHVGLANGTPWRGGGAWAAVPGSQYPCHNSYLALAGYYWCCS
ncbi:hypothetical protein E2C01_008151 [Portunus trituberculatus]|uniref:Uncharacterized protein n=1 Tax=Portunus trituberculatus TaxID=210409 RepID=A0A5B7D570_PORTR|nr:hypothetical protein [Portunus trituberculatus]